MNRILREAGAATAWQDERLWVRAAMMNERTLERAPCELRRARGRAFPRAKDHDSGTTTHLHRASLQVLLSRRHALRGHALVDHEATGLRPLADREVRNRTGFREGENHEVVERARRGSGMM